MNKFVKNKGEKKRKMHKKTNKNEFSKLHGYTGIKKGKKKINICTPVLLII